MARFYLVVGLAALSFYSWAQYRGVGLFDDVASSGASHSQGGRSAYHK